MKLIGLRTNGRGRRGNAEPLSKYTSDVHRGGCVTNPLVALANQAACQAPACSNKMHKASASTELGSHAAGQVLISIFAFSGSR